MFWPPFPSQPPPYEPPEALKIAFEEQDRRERRALDALVQIADALTLIAQTLAKGK